MKRALAWAAALLLLTGCGGTPTETDSLAEQTPLPGVTAGEYVYADGTVLTVAWDGALTYEPTLFGYVAGVPVAGLVTFTGSVDENGAVTLDSAFYHGVDITKGAARSGFALDSEWAAYAQAMYEGLQYYGSIDMTQPMQATEEPTS